MAAEEMESLRTRWSTLYSQTLPKLARAKDPIQPKWPVTLDHCFARIILDNTVGRGVLKWDNVIQRPAIKTMNQTQLKEAIALGEQILAGKADLVQLDIKSLEARGKNEKTYAKSGKHDREAANDDVEQQSRQKKSKTDGKKQSTLTFGRSPDRRSKGQTQAVSAEVTDSQFSSHEEDSRFANPNTPEFLVKIQNHDKLTPYRKRLYSTLLSVPPGYYTTYQAMATFLNSSARAVGSGMRNNPYAPDVPCHRVLASDGSIGGFFGDWGEEGKHAGKKRDLLRDEGVHFDSRGRVKGPVFRDFEDLSTRAAG